MDFKANLTTTTTRPPVAKPFILGSNVNVCAPLLETIQANYKKPNFNHTLQRTIGPAVAAITNNSYEYSYKRTPDENLSAEEEIPHTVQGEIAKLDAKFYIELDPLQHPQSKTIHMICKIDDVDLPCVPPIAIKVPMDYPSLPPRCYIDKQEYNSSKFLQDIYRIFNNNLEKLPNLYSITTLLDRWVCFGVAHADRRNINSYRFLTNHNLFCHPGNEHSGSTRLLTQKEFKLNLIVKIKNVE